MVGAGQGSRNSRRRMVNHMRALLDRVPHCLVLLLGASDLGWWRSAPWGSLGAIE
jgi:hypothetical protein